MVSRRVDVRRRRRRRVRCVRQGRNEVNEKKNSLNPATKKKKQKTKTKLVYVECGGKGRVLVSGCPCVLWQRRICIRVRSWTARPGPWRNPLAGRISTSSYFVLKKTHTHTRGEHMLRVPVFLGANKKGVPSIRFSTTT